MNSLVNKFVLFMAAIAIIAGSIGTVEAYDRMGARGYAQSHYYWGVPGSWYFGDNDCTNFVSQTLFNGGKIKMTVNHPTNKWWYDSIWSYSYSWVQVQAFRDFMVNSGRGWEYPLNGVTASSRPVSLTIGDIVQADGVRDPLVAADGTWEHTMIITEITNSDIFVTYRSNNRVDRPLSELFKAYPKSKYRVILVRNDT